MPQPLSLKIGPSGVRGVVGESLTPQLVTSFAAAFGTYCGAGPILIGTDTGPSGEMVKQAAIAGLLSVGCTPVDVGVVPIPALMFHVRAAGAFGGMSVSGRRGSPGWTAIRFIDGAGLALRANQAAELTDLYHQGFYPRVGALEMSDVRTDATSISRHLDAVMRAVDVERVRCRAFKVAVDAVDGAASVPTRRLLESLGCEVTTVNAASGPPHPADPDPDGEHLEELSALVRSSSADIGFAQDAYAVRLAVVDELGAPLGADASVALVVQRWLERKPGPVAVDVATSRAVDEVAARFGCPVYRSRVGEANVIATMEQRGAEVGGEGYGGAIVLPVNPCRDSFAAMAIILESIAVSDRPPSAVCAQVPRYAMVREHLRCSARDVAPSLRLIRSLFRGEQLDLTDGVKVTWPDRWLLARPSAAEPLIRVSAEAPTEAEARSLVNGVLDVLSPGA
jgi:phosphomannomutase